MKAQLSIEYYASLIIFILFVGYIFFQLITTSPHFIREAKNERLRIEAYQISELLINDPGEPIDWNLPTETVKRFGLSSNSNKTNLLDMNKIIAFNDSCNTNYKNVRSLIDTEYYFSINLNKTSGEKIENLIDCKPKINVTKQMKVSLSRVVALDSNEFAELVVQMW